MLKRSTMPANIMYGMDWTDGFWDYVVDPYGEGSDGIVQLSSQEYPSSSAVQYGIGFADSHLSSTRSNYVRHALDSALKNTFAVQTQASCTFSASPSSFSVSPSAANSSFTLSTGTGCNWSAVSNAPWISITSGSSGNASATIGFSVAANPITVPRSGTISAGDGNVSTTFTVFQAGVCTYSLSESEIVIPPGGGNYTVSVNTQSGCAWTAVSNASWLTISSGAGGSGTGTFTVTASPNSSDTDLSGTVTVMGQVLTVILGDPTGTPGAGSVTINGSPAPPYTFNSCQGNSYPAPTYCPQTIYEGGEIYITVGSQTFSTSFGSSSAQMASALASQMNYSGSPLIASVSGSTISIRSSINGAATNYSLSTSYQYGPTQYFSGPEFTASPSGPSLTGGTD